MRSIGAAAVLTASIMCSCTVPTARPPVRLQTTEAVWLYTEEIERYECVDGLLYCQDSTGRRSRRLCRCLP